MCHIKAPSCWCNTWIESDLLDDHLCPVSYSQTCFLSTDGKFCDTSDPSVRELFQESDRIIFWKMGKISREGGGDHFHLFWVECIGISTNLGVGSLWISLADLWRFSFASRKNENFWKYFFSHFKPLYLGQILTDWALVFCKHPHF